jgi:mRNA interferase MazF
MTAFKFGEIVLVPFPFTDQLGTKKRPAVVVSSDTYNAEHIDLVLMAITSQTTGKMRPSEVDIGDWRKAVCSKNRESSPFL